MKKTIVVIAGLLLAGAGAWWMMSGPSAAEPSSAAENRSSESEKRSPDRIGSESGISLSCGKGDAESASPQSDDSPSDPPAEEPLTEEEKAEAAAEAKVEAFDGLTDKWMEPAKAGVTMTDVDGFVAAFRQVPKDRQDECIHRALNLVPDENVMLLAGVLMDKTADKEIVETVFNDILNRDESVKMPILQQVFKDKSHPCWADTAWILDVTGEKK